MIPGTTDLRDLMFSLGWKIHVEDVLEILWIKTVSGQPKARVINLLTLAGVTPIGNPEAPGHFLITLKDP